MYSGAEEVHNRGVGGKLNREVWESLMVWVADILMKGSLRARFYVIFAQTTVLQTYAPTKEAYEEGKEDFYQQLQREIEKTPKHDILMSDVKGGGDKWAMERYTQT